MVSVYAIYGCHGAGKTTLARNILTSDGGEFTEHNSEYGHYTVSKNGNIIAVGKYSTKCGGADSLKGTEYYYKMLDWLVDKFPDKTILIEGIFFSGLFKSPLKELLHLKYDLGVKVAQVFLYTDVATSYQRVVARNGREPKLAHIKSKQNAVSNNIIKFRRLGEFPSVVINTIGKTEEQVFQEFMKFYEIYRGM